MNKAFPVRLLLLLLLVASAGYVGRVAVTVAAPGIMQDFHLSQAQMGTVFSAFLVGYTLCQIPSGLVADRIGVRPIFLFLSIAWTILSAATALIGWRGFAVALVLPQLWIIRGIFGVLAAPTYPTAGRTVAVTTAPHLRARATSLVLASIGIGSAITPLVLSPITAVWGWRAAILIAAGLNVIAWLVWLLFAPRELPLLAKDDPQLSTQRTAQILRSPKFWLLTASYCLQGYLGYIFIFWFYLYLVQVRHIHQLEAAGFTALPWIATVFAIPLGGVLSDAAVKRFGPATGRGVVPVVALAVSAFFLFVGARTPSALFAIAALTVCTVLVLATEGPFWAALTELAGQASGMAGGIMNFGSNLGGMISPTLTPWLAERIGWESALSFTAALALIAALLWLPMAKSGRWRASS